MAITITLTKEQALSVLEQLSGNATGKSLGNQKHRTAAQVLEEILEELSPGKMFSFGEAYEQMKKELGEVNNGAVSSALRTLKKDKVIQMVRKGTYKKL